MGKAVAKQTGGLLATMADLAQTAETGLESLAADAFALPFLKLAQAVSEEVKNRNSTLRAGDIFDTVSLAGAPEILVIPCSVRRVILEWAPRSAGKSAPVNEYSNWNEAKANAQSGNDLKETYNYTVLYSLDEGDSFSPARLSMNSTKVKVARRWNTNLQTLRVPFNGTRINPPMFGTIWTLSSVEEKNQHGIFYNFGVTFNSLVEDEMLFGQAQHLNEISSEVHAQPVVEAEVVEEESDGADF
jgi:hypothetical protein